MGRGNACVRGKYEGLYYIDNDYFEALELDENENPVKDQYGYSVHDYDLERDQWEDDLCLIKEYLKKQFPSLSDCDQWINNSEHVILENRLFYIVIEDNEWSMAIKLIEKEDYYINIAGLQAGNYQKYLEGIKYVLFNLYPKIGVYGGAWTSGTIERPENFKFMSA